MFYLFQWFQYHYKNKWKEDVVKVEWVTDSIKYPPRNDSPSYQNPFVASDQIYISNAKPMRQFQTTFKFQKY